jgi:serine/threonine protein kinase
MDVEATSTLNLVGIEKQQKQGTPLAARRARDNKLGRDVAIKVLPAALSENADRLNRFEQEAQAAGAFSHPNILSIYHIGTREGAPYTESLSAETSVNTAW